MIKYFITIFLLIISFSSLPVASEENMSFLLNGKKVDFLLPVVVKNDIVYLPANDKGTKKIVNYFNGLIEIGTEDIYINRLGHAYRFKYVPSGSSFIENNVSYISLNDLSNSLHIHYEFDRENNNYLLFPEFYNITFNRTDNIMDILFSASGRISYTTGFLDNCFGFFIDIPDCYISSEREFNCPEDNVIKSVSPVVNKGLHPSVRIEIKLLKPFPVNVGSRIDLTLLPVRIDCSPSCVTELWLPDISKSFLDNLPGRESLIKKINVEEKNDKSTVKISSTGLVNYEWHKMTGDDNRFYMDFSRALFQGKNIISAENSLISNIKLISLKDNPQITRMVFNLKDKAKIEILPSDKNELVISLMKSDVSDEIISGKGNFGSSRAGGKVIVIDPGHGGADTGAINSSFGILEKNMNLSIALKLRELLVNNGYSVIVTRETDRDVTWDGSPNKVELQARVDAGNEHDADLYISIHHDSSTNTGLSGTCTFYYKDIDYEFARIAQKNLVSALGLRDRGLVRNDFYVLKHTEMPSVLLEVAFMSNSNNASLIITPEFRQKAAEAICNAVIEYFTIYEP